MMKKNEKNEIHEKIDNECKLFTTPEYKKKTTMRFAKNTDLMAQHKITRSYRVEIYNRDNYEELENKEASRSRNIRNTTMEG